MKRTKDMADLSLYAALFQDIAAWEPDLHDCLVADYQRLVHTVKSRGMPFIMIDMPEAGRTFDSALSRGFIDFDDLPGTFGRSREGTYRPFLSCLFSKVFNGAGILNSSVDETSIFFLRTVLNFAKKIEEPCSDAAILREVDAFKEIDNALRDPTLCWNASDVFTFDMSKRRVSFLDAYSDSPNPGDLWPGCPRPLLEILDAVSSRLSSLFGNFDWRDINPRHGPGATADAKTGTDKYLFSYWPEKLESVFPYTFFAFSREDMHLEVTCTVSPDELPARLIAVPKTLKGPRMIASEPVAHQFIQLGLMEWIRNHLPKPLKTSVSFKSQEPSRDLCLKASKSERYGTVDLSSASDRLSCWVVERIFRANPGIIDALFASRTRRVTNATRIGDPWIIDLKKFAPMGSGVTFPVQTVCYAIVCIATLLYERNDKPTLANISSCAKEIQVFGDDIIMPSFAVPTLAHLLAYLQLKVNGTKTHYKGHFRESCGMDAYNGVDVTPLYLSSLELETTATNLESWIDVCNNAYLKGLWCLSDHMVRLIPARLRSRIPVSSKALGCLTLRSLLPTSLNGKVRFSRTLHRDEVLGLSFEVKEDKRRRESHSSLLQYFIEKPHPETRWESGYVVRNRSRLRKRWVPWYITTE